MGVLLFIYSVLLCVYAGCGSWLRFDIAGPGNISQQFGIQRSAVWHFSTDCRPAVRGVAEPCYLLPDLELRINQTNATNA